MMELKDALGHIGAQLGELETAARTLANQNLADIIASARAKLTQASEHADIEHAQTALMAAMEADRLAAVQQHNDTAGSFFGASPPPMPGA